MSAGDTARRAVLRAYRKRVRYAKRHALAEDIVHQFAQLTFPEKVGIAAGLLTLPDIECPVCNRVVWQGVRRRADTKYCSAACRSKAYRERRKQQQ